MCYFEVFEVVGERLFFLGDYLQLVLQDVVLLDQFEVVLEVVVQQTVVLGVGYLWSGQRGEGSGNDRT